MGTTNSEEAAYRMEDKLCQLFSRQGSNAQNILRNTKIKFSLRPYLEVNWEPISGEFLFPTHKIRYKVCIYLKCKFRGLERWLTRLQLELQCENFVGTQLSLKYYLKKMRLQFAQISQITYYYFLNHRKITQNLQVDIHSFLYSMSWHVGRQNYSQVY